jgi:hypothetical protein
MGVERLAMLRYGVNSVVFPVRLQINIENTTEVKSNLTGKTTEVKDKLT